MDGVTKIVKLAADPDFALFARCDGQGWLRPVLVCERRLANWNGNALISLLMRSTASGTSSYVELDCAKIVAEASSFRVRGEKKRRNASSGRSSQYGVGIQKISRCSNIGTWVNVPWARECRPEGTLDPDR